jgi:CubicO group peptidase (beta-lactamase class C family)
MTAEVRTAGAPALDEAHWRARLTDLAAKHDVPGATLGMLRLGRGGDERVEASYGVLNKATGVAVTTDSLFQIGSITKLWTATVVLQLAGEGLLSLDQPVVELLPEMRLSDPSATKDVTLRHLLTHTSGIDGDAFIDTGRGDDCLEAYVERLDEVAQNFPVGATWSYCNTGFSILGRVIEKVTGQVWDSALRERLVAPLGLTHVATLPEEALLFRTAVGHVSEAGQEPRPASIWAMERSGGPTGSLLSMTVGDLLTFARMHLSGGRTADGTAVLDEELVRRMQERHVDLPGEHGIADSWGLSWARYEWGAHTVVGHNGTTIGQSAFLRMLPEQGLVFVLLTNGGRSHDLYGSLVREVFDQVAGIRPPDPFAPPTDPAMVSIEQHAGRYSIAGADAEVFERDSRAVLRMTDTSIFADANPSPVEEFDLHPVTPDLFAIRAEGEETWTPVAFLALPDGRPALHAYGRSLPKVRAAAS